MKLKNKVYLKMLPMHILNCFNKIERNEFLAFLDISDYILSNEDIGNLDDKYMVAVKVSHSNSADVVSVTVNHIERSAEITILVGNYGRDDYWYYDLTTAINKIFGNKYNNWDIVDIILN